MFNKLFQGALVGAAMLGFVGAAAATNFEINLYGASAQYLYWNDAADNFLSSVKGCGTVAQAQSTDKKHGITTGSACTNGHTYTIRYSSKASYDGILSLKNDKSQAGSSEICNDGDPILGGGAIAAGQSGYYRKMASAVGTPNTLGCAKVNLGASDVAGASFVQETHGCLKGPVPTQAGWPNCTGNDWVNRTFTGIPTNTLASAQPLVVPFGFFANNCVTKTKCIGPEPRQMTKGNYYDCGKQEGICNLSTGLCTQGKENSPCTNDDQCDNNECLTGPVGQACTGGTCNTGTGLCTTGKVGDPCTTDLNCYVDSTCGVSSYNPISTDPDDKAAGTWGNQCWDPDNDGHSADCIGYYKCISRKCVGGVNAGEPCDQVTDCPDVSLAATRCERIPIDNVSRLMVTQIFSGQALYWQDFGKWWDGDCGTNGMAEDGGSDPIVSCMRHAGSGTQATFDIFMKGSFWGLGLPTTQSTTEPIAWFNDGSGDMMTCIATVKGSIGYADCDQLVGTTASGTSNFPYEKVHAVKLDGVECKRAKIRNGEYPFYSANWNFWRAGDPEAALIGDLITYASNPNNLPLGKRDYWAAKSEMVFLKGNDTSWPTWVGGDGSQLP